MTRKKVKLAFIENDTKRRTCFRKRKKGLIKKVQELGILCDIDACVIICSPYDDEPEVWPNTPSKVDEVLSRFKELGEIEQCRKMVDQEGYIKQRIMKVHEQFRRTNIDNRLKETKCFLRHILEGKLAEDFEAFDLDEIRWSIFFTLKEIAERALVLRQQTPPPPPGPIPTIETNTENVAESPAVVAPEIPMNENQNQTAAAGNMDAQQPNDQSYFDDFGWEESTLLYSLLENPDQAPTLGFL